MVDDSSCFCVFNRCCGCIKLRTAMALIGLWLIAESVNSGYNVFVEIKDEKETPWMNEISSFFSLVLAIFYLIASCVKSYSKSISVRNWMYRCMVTDSIINLVIGVAAMNAAHYQNW